MMFLLTLVALATAEKVHWCQEVNAGGMKMKQGMTLIGDTCMLASLQPMVDVLASAGGEAGLTIKLEACVFDGLTCAVSVDDMGEAKAQFSGLTAIGCSLENNSMNMEIPQMMKDLGVDTCEQMITMMKAGQSGNSDGTGGQGDSGNSDTCDQQQTSDWENAWTAKVAEGGAVAAACKKIENMDLSEACTCMNGFDQAPPDCIYQASNSNPFKGWRDCRLHAAGCDMPTMEKFKTLPAMGRSAGGDCTAFEEMMMAGTKKSEQEEIKDTCDCVGKISDANFKIFDCHLPEGENYYQMRKEHCTGRGGETGAGSETGSGAESGKDTGSGAESGKETGSEPVDTCAAMMKKIAPEMLKDGAIKTACDPQSRGCPCYKAIQKVYADDKQFAKDTGACKPTGQKDTDKKTALEMYNACDGVTKLNSEGVSDPSSVRAFSAFVFVVFALLF